ncbi:hypothetical protein FOPG_18367 [Fusarium oxysporum f. sp. conglutinans race 2 54008]|uniref:Uncharacterized protein n=1 Tax=Fusarium oxysporum f. sp. conglutinans race 2 54008 TaxID=1089457 RepID=X0GQ20_FUSOX|nr:hypothetical protein FOPG_18367 [Fusarium oxysporum f. sp. conglutinans race 2 54008]
MDPLSVAASCVALIQVAEKTFTAIKSFIIDCKGARGDLGAINHELSDLKLTLHLLQGLIPEDGELFSSIVSCNVEEQIQGIIANCLDVTKDIDKVLSEHRGRFAAASWAVQGKQRIAALKRLLEADRRALSLAVDTITLAATKDIKNDTGHILDDTAGIKESSSRILEEIARLKAALITHENLAGSRTFLLRRYLDDLTSVAESARDNLSRPSSPESSFESSFLSRTELPDLGNSEDVALAEHGPSSTPTILVDASSCPSVEESEDERTTQSSSTVHITPQPRLTTVEESMADPSDRRPTNTEKGMPAEISDPTSQLYLHLPSAAWPDEVPNSPRSASHTKACDNPWSVQNYNQTNVAQTARLDDRMVVGLVHGKEFHDPGRDKGEARTLHEAAKDGLVEVVNQLLKNGADVTSRDDDGWAPINLAAGKGHEAVARLLVEKGAALEAKDNDGNTPLSRVAINGHEAVAKLLVEKGANLEAEDEDGYTPLSLAAVNGHEAVARLLVEKGANLEAKDEDGYTPLSLAAYNGHKAMAILLIEKGADLEAKDEDGYTPLSLAAFNGHKAVARLLVEKGARKGWRDRFWLSILTL